MAKGNMLGSAAGAMTGSGQYRPSSMRQPGTAMAKSGGSGNASVSIKGGTDLLSSLKSIMADLDAQPGNSGGQSDANSRYGSNLMMPNYYSNFTNPSLMNPFSSWSSYSPYGTGGYNNFANQPKGQPTAPPAAPTGPKWATGNDALNHINSQLTRGLAADEIDYIKKNVGYNDGGVDEPMMSSIMALIKQNKPELLR